MLEEKEIKDLLTKIPHAPGIYKMIDVEGRVIYVGKAKDLRKRVVQYFRKNYEHSYRTKKMLENIKRIDFTSVDSDLEAIILENNVIKQFQPKYNILLKDDKSFVYVRISKEVFPRVHIVREIRKDGATYIGPKTQAYKLKETLKFLKKLFPYRHCSLGIDLISDDPVVDKKTGESKYKMNITNRTIKYPCLDFFIKRCVAPCVGACSVSDYAEIVKNVEDFLLGRPSSILEVLERQMRTYAEDKNFEKAAKVRDKILKVKDVLESQKVETANGENQDVVNYFVIQGKAYFNLFQIRGGKLIGQENFTLSAEDFDEASVDSELLEAFLSQYYELATDFPKEVLIPHEITNLNEVEDSIYLLTGKKTKIGVPKIGRKNKLLDMSLNNAKIFADRNKFKWQEEGELTILAAEELAKVLNIEKKLRRIECYDISHLGGTETVGSMVVFVNGVPKKDHYRKFKLRTVVGKPDDFKSMREVFMRRFSKISLLMQTADLTLRKAVKKDKELLEKLQFGGDGEIYFLGKKDQTVAALNLYRKTEKAIYCEEFWIDKDFGIDVSAKLIKELAKKMTKKRFYFAVDSESKESFLLNGFEEIKNLPNWFEGDLKDKEILVYDSNKHVEDKSFSEVPDLIIIDGGKGQLSSGVEVLRELNLESIKHVSLAKRLEEIFVPGLEMSIVLERSNEALKLLQRMRDEAHRFAITFNRDLRSKKLKSLD